MSKIGLATLLIGLATASAAAAADPARCSIEALRRHAPADAIIDSVTPIPVPIPHCEVLGHIITQNPGPNRVEFSVMLPDERFNSRFYFVGEGAAAGFVPTARPGDPANAGYLTTTLKLLGEGFVVAGSDTGHKGSMWDFAINNPAAKLDHGHRGAHVSTVAAQAITKAYYGMSNRLYRYHLGCSGGGRMGAMAALHHPQDYDAVVVSTGFGEGGSMWFPWILQHLIKHPESWVSPQKLAFLEKKVAERCADPDGLVRDPNACGFDPASLQCRGRDGDDCLTVPEVMMIKRITSPHPTGPGTTSGGFSLTNPTGWSSFLLGVTRPTSTSVDNPWAPGSAPSSYRIGHSILRGIYFNDAKFNFIEDLDFNNPAHLRTLQEGHPAWGAVSPDLSAYKKAGGKVMLWAPLGENAVPPATEIQYYHAVQKAVPGADDFMRLYVVPGVLHCAGGPGPQDTPDRLLDKAIAWVEEGKRPNEIVTSASNPNYVPPPAGAPLTAPPPSRTVLICPYPQRAVFAGRKGGFAYDAANWKCQGAQR